MPSRAHYERRYALTGTLRTLRFGVGAVVRLYVYFRHGLFDGIGEGVEFIVREVAQRVFPKSTLTQLPPVVMQYSVTNREKLNKKIVSGAPLKQLAP